jgi:hypothetical protein
MARPAARDLPPHHGTRYFHGCYTLADDRLWVSSASARVADPTGDDEMERADGVCATLLSAAR